MQSEAISRLQIIASTPALQEKLKEVLEVERE